MGADDQQLDARGLLDLLALLEDQYIDPVTLVAAGGTALTLLNVKPATRDIDLTGPRASIDAFRRARATFMPRDPPSTDMADDLRTFHHLAVPSFAEVWDGPADDHWDAA